MLQFGAPAALALLGFVPLIVALYFMRSRPRRHIVSTNRIWEQVLERKRRESILGRFRNSLFLFLHILLVVLGALALAQPTRPGGLRGDTLFIVDTTASMGATDETGGRLQAAKARVRELLAKLDTESRASLVEAGLRVVPLVAPTTDREQFLTALAGLEVVDCAGPDPSDIVAFLSAGSRAAWARTYFVTDNCASAPIADAPGIGVFQEVRVGQASENLGIVALEVTDVQGGKDVAARVGNFGPLPARLRATLRSASSPATLGTTEASVASGAEQSLVFRKIQAPAGALSVRVEPTGSPDYLACDDTAHAVIGRKKRRVLLIDRVNSPLRQVLESKRLALDVTRVNAFEFPKKAAELASYDAVVADGFYDPALEGKNLLLFAAPAPGGPATGQSVVEPVLSVADPTHPAMRYLTWDDVHVRQATLLTRKGKPLLLAPGGVLAAAFETGGARQLVLGFTLSDSDLAFRVAFPILVANALGWMSGEQGMAEAGKKAGDLVRLPAGVPAASVRQDGRERAVQGRLERGELVLDVLRKTGIVEAKSDRAEAAWAVNLLSLAESNIRPAAAPADAEAAPRQEEGRRPVWRQFMWVLLAVLLLEWMLWHRLGG